MKKLPERKKELLCTNVDALRMTALVLFHAETKEEVQAMVREIVRKAILIKKQALAMEKRLYLYKETIEGLGFKRIRMKYKR